MKRTLSAGGALLLRALDGWLALVRRRASWVLVLCVLSTGIALQYTRTHLGINTDTADMMSPQLAWRQDSEAYDRAFSRFVDNLLLVIDGRTPESAQRAAARLARALAADDDRFHWVERPGHDPFFERHAFLYLDLAALNDLADRLSAAQPFLGTLVAQPDMVGLFDLLARAVREPDAAQDAELSRVFDAVAASVGAHLAGRDRELSWRALLLGDQATSSERRAFITVKPRLDYADLLPAGPAIERIRSHARTLGIDPAHGLRVRITGGLALSYEEMQTVSSGVERAGVLALLMVFVVLVVGLRSFRLVFASLATLLVGLSWTAAFAAYAVGNLNLISIAFAVLYIGLGVDYAVHLCLHYRDALAAGEAPDAALRTAGRDVGGALLLCAVTTGIGFYAFIPTSFLGVRELGIISGTGMFISVVASLTMLPAVLGLSGPPRLFAMPTRSWRWRRVARLPRERRVAVLVVAALCGALALAGAFRVWFDDNPLDLRDPESESVQTFRELLRDPRNSPWTLDVLAPDATHARVLAARLARLPEVKEVRSLADLIPAEQQAKLAIIEDLDLLLGLDIESAAPPPVDDGARRAAIARLAAALAETPPRSETTALRKAVGTLVARQPSAASLARLDRTLSAGLPEELRLLREALAATPVTRADLPASVVSRWIGRDGGWRVDILPAENLQDRAAMGRFVDAVRAVAPHATGGPISNLESGRGVVRAFIQAFMTALILIIVVLLVALRRVADVALALAPLLLSGLYTVGLMGWLDMPFNFANVIALPLLLGIGVDSGIHVLHRTRSARPGSDDLLATSTARAITVSALTTIVSFGSLAFSPHPGTASMGMVLAVGMTAVLICTLVVLPAALWSMLARRSPGSVAAR